MRTGTTTALLGVLLVGCGGTLLPDVDAAIDTRETNDAAIASDIVSSGDGSADAAQQADTLAPDGGADGRVDGELPFHPPETLPSRFSCLVSGDSVMYLSAAEMCDYLNAWRGRDQELALAARSCPSGSSWSIPFVITPEASSVAQAEAERVASGGMPRGLDLITGGAGYTVFYNDATEAPPVRNDVTYTSHQGMTEGRMSSEGTQAVCVFDAYLADIRIAMRIFACRGDGHPEAMRMGCGAAVDRRDGGATVWRVVKILP